MGSTVDLSRGIVVACGVAASVSVGLPGFCAGVLAVCLLLFIMDA